MNRRWNCIADGSGRDLAEVIRGADGRVDDRICGTRQPFPSSRILFSFVAKHLRLCGSGTAELLRETESCACPPLLQAGTGHAHPPARLRLRLLEMLNNLVSTYGRNAGEAGLRVSASGRRTSALGR